MGTSLGRGRVKKRKRAEQTGLEGERVKVERKEGEEKMEKGKKKKEEREGRGEVKKIGTVETLLKRAL